MRATLLAATVLLSTMPATADPSRDDRVLQAATLEASGCMRATAPRAYIATGRSLRPAVLTFTEYCYPKYVVALTNAGFSQERIYSSFQSLAGWQWADFLIHVDSQ